MDNQLAQEPKNSPVPPVSEAKPSLFKKTFTPKFIIALGVLLIVGGSAYGYVSYLAWKNYDEVTRQAQLAQESNRIVYSNELFGFSIALPDSWKGYTVNHIKEDIYDITGRTTTNNGVVDSLQLIELHHPLESANNPREVMPIMVFTLEQWMRVFNQEWSVGAAPIPPSLLGQNSQWVIALPARYNYDFKPGWEEVDQLVHTIQVFEPSPSTSSGQLDMSNWKTYTNTKYGFEFKYLGDYIAFTGLNSQSETIIPPNSSSSEIMIAKNDNQIFCCEPLIFSIKIQSRVSDDLDVWVNREFINSDNSYRVTKKGFEEFAGQSAYRVYSDLGIDSPRNIVAFNYAGRTLLIRYDNEDIFNQILSTFRFTK